MVTSGAWPWLLKDSSRPFKERFFARFFQADTLGRTLIRAFSFPSEIQIKRLWRCKTLNVIKLTPGNTSGSSASLILKNLMPF